MSEATTSAPEMNASQYEWPFFTSEHRAFARRVAEFARGAGIEDDDAHPGKTCEAWVEAAGSAGLLAGCVPQGDARAIHVRMLCVARETLGYVSALADFAFAMQGLGIGPVSFFGSPEQRARYLPPVAEGRLIPAFALSERDAGSDVSAIRTTARRDGDGYVIDGEKMWISNAGIAGVYVVFARTGGPGAKGLSAFVVDASTPGIEPGAPTETIAPHPLAPLSLRGVRVAESARIGAEGDGFKIAMATLDVFRCTVGAAAIGMARRAFDESVRYSKERQLFGAPLASLQLTQSSLAHMATEIDAAALLVYRAAWTKDNGAARVTREAAMAKWFATEAASRICDRAVQMFGGLGVTRGSIVERLYRDVRALRIYEGASEVQQLVIARSVLEA
ncbi:MAG TPA: acyl-CoA dehydrogenase family protein [Candidatus Tumulicola sp.]